MAIDMVIKTTYGWVNQSFDDNGNCIHQEFVAGYQVEYEDGRGHFLSDADVQSHKQREKHFGFEMVQPEE